MGTTPSGFACHPSTGGEWDAIELMAAPAHSMGLADRFVQKIARPCHPCPAGLNGLGVVGGVNGVEKMDESGCSPYGTSGNSYQKRIYPFLPRTRFQRRAKRVRIPSPLERRVRLQLRGIQRCFPAKGQITLAVPAVPMDFTDAPRLLVCGSGNQRRSVLPWRRRLWR